MFVAAADKHHISFLRPKVTGIDIGRYISARQVADVLEAVGIGEGRCNQIAFGTGHFRNK
jgi:hypothetical protein